MKVQFLNSQAYAIPCLRMDDEQSKIIKEAKIENIISMIATDFGINVEKLKTRTRKREVVLPRQVVEYVFVNHFDFTLKQAAGVLGLDRNHTSVIHSKKTIEDLCDTEPHFKKYIKSLIGKISKHD